MNFIVCQKSNFQRIISLLWGSQDVLVACSVDPVREASQDEVAGDQIACKVAVPGLWLNPRL